MNSTDIVSLYQRTFIENENSVRENLLNSSAHANRKLAVQLESNIARAGWNAHAGVALLEDKVEAANAIVDDEKGLNNYADSCLANLSRFKNSSKDWKCSISLDDELIQSFFTAQDESKKKLAKIDDFHIKRCMKRELKPNIDNKTKPTSTDKCFDRTTQSHGSIFPSNDKESSNFDLIPDEIPTFSSSNIDKPQVKPEFLTKSTISNRFISPRFPQPSLSGPTNSVGNSTATGQNNSNKLLNKFGGYNKTSRAFYPTTGNSDNQGPRPPSFSNGNPSAQAAPPTSAFKTAHQQLVIDNHNKGRQKAQPSGGENYISSSSYGSGRRNLGTRPGPASGFKPPVRCPDEQGGGGVYGGVGAARQRTEGQNEELQDERYKNIDPKMIEVITNEIMDQGPPVTWDDIAGLEFAKNTVKEIVVWPMLRPDIFTGLRGPPKGLLLFGPPGTGKTLIGKCIASQSHSTFFSISASSLTSKWVGEGEKMVRTLFAVAKVNQPSVVFIDEIDSLLSSRSDSEHESSRRIKTEFLVQLDGAGPAGGERVLVVGATNRPQELDEAARRRLVKRLYIPLPEAEARNVIIQNLLSKERHEVSEEQVAEVCRQTEGYSGADMANLCKEAALGPIRSLDFGQIQSVQPDQVRPISYNDLLAALRQVKASVSQKDLDLYLEWNDKYGAGK